VIHHVGVSPSEDDIRGAFRARMNRGFFTDLVRRQHMDVIEQDESHVHKPGDTITVLKKPTRP
jgi:hypothetical protein